MPRIDDRVELACTLVHLLDREIDQQNRVLRDDAQQQQDADIDRHRLRLAEQPDEQDATKRCEREAGHVDQRAHQALVQQHQHGKDQQNARDDGYA